MSIIAPFLAHTQLYTSGSGITDIDGNNYSTIIINGQEWMAENLRTTSYSNGDSITNVTDETQWSNLSTGAWAHYNNDSQFENPFGKLYNWYAVKDSRNVCPTGWNVPSDNEWNTFINYLDPNADGGNIYPNIAGGKMKSVGTQYWQSPNTDATNESGFSGLPGGYRNSYGIFHEAASHCYWWGSVEKSSNSAWYRCLFNSSGEAYRDFFLNSAGLSVRCIKNNTAYLDEKLKNPKKLLKIVNALGTESEEKTNELLFYIYSDGSVEKKIIKE
jgi:uncharacterized protein (TIGR02145 family)